MSEITIDYVLTLARRLPIDQRRQLLVRLSTELPPQPPTLADQLASARSQIVASGTPLLDWKALEAEIAERRGER